MMDCFTSILSNQDPGKAGRVKLGRMAWLDSAR